MSRSEGWLTRPLVTADATAIAERAGRLGTTETDRALPMASDSVQLSAEARLSASQGAKAQTNSFTARRWN